MTYKPRLFTFIIKNATLSFRIVVTIAVNAVRNIICNEATFERTETLFIMLTLFFGEYTVYLDQNRLDVHSLAKFDLFEDTLLQTDRIELYGGLRQQRSDIIRFDVLLFDKSL